MARLKLKLVINRRENRVLFAEAGKDFADLIFHIRSFPLSTAVRILSENGESVAAPGWLGHLYQGIKDLSDGYMDPVSEECVLKLKAPFRGKACRGLLPEASRHDLRSIRPQCCPDNELPLFGSPASEVEAKGGDEGGYVKQKAMLFMVTDDLVVKPMSAVSMLLLMGSEDSLSNFESREVKFGMKKALKLLKATLMPEGVLTDVFLSDVGAPTDSKRPRLH